MPVRQDALLVCAFLFVAQACGGSAMRPVQTAAPRNESPSTAAPAASKDDGGGQTVIAVSKDIRDACGIGDPQAFFSYNSAQVSSQDDALFKQLAACFSTGALKDRAMRLVGYTDPRGEEDYNYLLGQRRADRVKDAIVAAGLSSPRVSTTSRGENDAAGQDETGWSKDRRVEILIGDAL